MDPTLRLERQCWAAGDQVVVGIDEVGRGSWAGPVTVAAVVPAREHLSGVRDSKAIARAKRPQVAAEVQTWAQAVGVGHASPQECDEWGMTEALRQAAMRALAQIESQGFVADRIILDGSHNYLGLGDRVITVVKGDTSILAVAAASCVAKVVRDEIMTNESENFPPTGLSPMLVTPPRFTKSRWPVTVPALFTVDRGCLWTRCPGATSLPLPVGCCEHNAWSNDASRGPKVLGSSLWVNQSQSRFESALRRAFGCLLAIALSPAWTELPINRSPIRRALAPRCLSAPALRSRRHGRIGLFERCNR